MVEIDRKKLSLVVMAAGMGSRFGGLKQLEPVGPGGEFILEYSVYDAWRHGFQELIIIIKEENRELFHEAIGKRVEKFMEVKYAVQDTGDLPHRFMADEKLTGRVKPWGTGHAVYAARELINHPFMVINADDFYGRDTFREMARLLRELEDGTGAMVAFPLSLTMSRSGGVSRGVCVIDEEGCLRDIVEHTDIRYDGERILSCGENLQELLPGCPVSMNVWGFSQEILPMLTEELGDFLGSLLQVDKAEFQLPTAVNRLVQTGRLRILAGRSEEKWYGITYRSDKESVMEGIRGQVLQGRYPEALWEEEHGR